MCLCTYKAHLCTHISLIDIIFRSPSIKCFTFRNLHQRALTIVSNIPNIREGQCFIYCDLYFWTHIRHSIRYQCWRILPKNATSSSTGEHGSHHTPNEQSESSYNTVSGVRHFRSNTLRPLYQRMPEIQFVIKFFTSIEK